MAEEIVKAAEQSPRSVIPSERMTTALSTAMDETTPEDLTRKSDQKAPVSVSSIDKESPKEENSDTAKSEYSDDKEVSAAAGKQSTTTSDDIRGSPPPTPASQQYEYPAHLQAGYPALTPQQGSGYYPVYLPVHPAGMTPEPPSPAAPHALYDASSLLQQGTGFMPPPGTSILGGVANITSPLSPPRVGMHTVSLVGASVLPASPLFPRVNSSGFDSSRGSAPPLPYTLSPQIGGTGSGIYHGYPSSGMVNSQNNDDGAWGATGAVRHGQPNYSSPQIGAGPMNYGISSARAPSGTRAYSFDETMLPPAALEAQDLGNPAYSPYSASQSPSGGSLFNQSSWGYAAGAPDMYNPPGSPLHPRPTNHMPMYPNMMPGGMGGSPPPGGMRGAPMYGGQYFPASSPGPPIQTTSSNKGPDGANLFIFHIPNHFTNVDMYQLFSPFGNLLSVRIMVEKDTGRSRGFGFVSYDSPESAALAIKELNGFPIGNKRLKVQHKQIRRNEVPGHEQSPSRDHFSHSFSGDADQQSLWFDTAVQQNPLAESCEVKLDPKLSNDEFPTENKPDQERASKESPLTNLDDMKQALPDIAAQETLSGNKIETAVTND